MQGRTSSRATSSARRASDGPPEWKRTAVPFKDEVASARQRREDRRKTYAYTMHVTETVESRCVVESNRKLTFRQLEKWAEKRRVNGELTETGVSDVRIWLENASVDGVEFDTASDFLIAR